MYTVLVVIILLICVILALVVLVQNSKGGGLASNLQSQNQYMGVHKTADFLEKATWTLAIILMVLSLACVALVPKHNNDNEAPKSAVDANYSTNNIPTMPTTQTPAPAAENAPAAQPTAE